MPPTPHRVTVLVYDGWYRWYGGYWYPAWGYDPQNNYYPYDGPIYTYNGLAPDQVVANVQAMLQGLRYYDGAISGILDSATRAAIARTSRITGFTSLLQLTRQRWQNLACPKAANLHEILGKYRRQSQESRLELGATRCCGS